DVVRPAGGPGLAGAAPGEAVPTRAVPPDAAGPPVARVRPLPAEGRSAVTGAGLAVVRPVRPGLAVPVRARTGAAGDPVAERRRGSEVIVIGAVPG
ncbi:MAG: hypothetical protein V7633_5161, partial [Pseudonocardia sp.]